MVAVDCFVCEHVHRMGACLQIATLNHEERTDHRTRKMKKEPSHGVMALTMGLCLVQTSFCQDVSYPTHDTCSLFLACSLREPVVVVAVAVAVAAAVAVAVAAAAAAAAVSFRFVSFHSQRGSPSLASVFCQNNIRYVAPAVFDSTYICKYGTEPAATAPKSQVKHGSVETRRRKIRTLDPEKE